MTMLRIALALAVAGVGLAFVACGVALPLDSDAEAAIVKTCDAMQTSSFDMAVDLTVAAHGEATRSVKIQYRIDGADSHAIFTSDGSTETSEQIVKDGVMYYRERSSNWQSQSWDSIPTFDWLCEANAANYEYIGESELVNGASMKHYAEPRAVSGSSPAAAPGPDATTSDEIWVDPNGYVIRGRIVQVVAVSSGNSPAGGVSGSSSGNQVSTWSYTVSGYGEPNVITAPALPTVAPSPTPTAAP